MRKEDFSSHNWMFERLSQPERDRLKNKVMKNNPKTTKEAEYLLNVFCYDFLCKEDLMRFEDIASNLGLPLHCVTRTFYKGMEKVKNIIIERNLEL